jgi:Fur family transcriptional regulator, ferric uptake regulator
VEEGRNRANRDALLAAGRAFDRAFSVRELHRDAAKRRPGIGLTTAYRAVERWRRDGLVEDAGSRDGEAVFVLCDRHGHHHHVVCVGCGAEAVLEECPLDDLRAVISRTGFELVDDAMAAIPGRCAECAPGSP